VTHTVRHGRVELALHELRVGDGERRLLLLHGLGERTPAEPPAWTAGWPGAVWGLDFTGHGASTRPAGGGYTAEMLMADTDAALAELGPSTVLGRGVGAYVALLVAGARPALARGAVLADGPGLWGGGPVPSSIVLSAADGMAGTPDPWAMSELSRDVRPPDYATGFARQATQLSGLDWPVSVCARARPPWLEAVATEPGVVETTVTEALELYAAES
jgi:pimeloyl-ACP methyl ester carboxylesterase